MHCHSNHAPQHSHQVLSVCESRGFCAMELLAPSPLVAGPGAVNIHRACRAESGCLPLRQIPYPHPAPIASRSPRGHSRSFLAHPLQLGRYPSSGRCGLLNLRTVSQQTAGLCKPGSRCRPSQVGHHFDGFLHVDVCSWREFNNVPVPMPGLTWQHCCTRPGGHMAISVETVFLRHTLTPQRRTTKRLSMRPISDISENVFDHFRRVPITSETDQHSTF